MGATQAVGRVTELWRYPVKSMQGEQVTSLELASGGVVGDRAFGLVDAATGRLLSAKSVPALFEAQARTVGEPAGGSGGGPGGSVLITLPDGREVGSDDPDAAAVLSAWLGRDVVLRRSGDELGDGSIEFEMRPEPDDDGGELFAWPAREGTFLDSAPVHVLTTASLATMGAVQTESVWDVRRFRPNLLIDTDGIGGFVEDEWIGRAVAFGSSAAVLSVGGACGRCAMPNRAQPAVVGGSADRPALPRDIGVFRALTAEHGNNLGVYADVVTAGRIAVADEALLRD